MLRFAIRSSFCIASSQLSFSPLVIVFCSLFLPRLNDRRVFFFLFSFLLFHCFCRTFWLFLSSFLFSSCFFCSDLPAFSLNIFPIGFSPGSLVCFAWSLPLFSLGSASFSFLPPKLERLRPSISDVIGARPFSFFPFPAASGGTLFPSRLSGLGFFPK